MKVDVVVTFKTVRGLSDYLIKQLLPEVQQRDLRPVSVKMATIYVTGEAEGLLSCW